MVLTAYRMENAGIAFTDTAANCSSSSEPGDQPSRTADYRTKHERSLRSAPMRRLERTGSTSSLRASRKLDGRFKTWLHCPVKDLSQGNAN